MNINKTTASPDRVQEIWSHLSLSDRTVMLGHSNAVLSAQDRQRFLHVMGAAAAQRRR